MSLYYEAAALLQAGNNNSSLATRVFNAKDLKSKPAQVYALLSEAAIWSPVLSPIIEVADVLKHERKLTPVLALLLVHDLLLSKKGIACPKGHALRLSIEKHKARLSAELTRARLKAGHATLATWRHALAQSNAVKDEDEGSESGTAFRHARWVRINALRTTLDAQLTSTFKDHLEVPFKEVLSANPSHKVYASDSNIPNLLALPPGHELTRSEAYTQGRIILQDKASCFPAYLLNVSAEDGDFIDACAAPGNKTTHLACLLAPTDPATSTNSTANPNSNSNPSPNSKPKSHTIYAAERDGPRSLILSQMIKKAGATNIVHCLPKQDFLRLNPHDDRFKNVTALLLDPSCSGSGIVGRDDGDGAGDAGMPLFVLPRMPTAGIGSDSAKSRGAVVRGRKRKRGGKDERLVAADIKGRSVADGGESNGGLVTDTEAKADVDSAAAPAHHKPLAERLEALSTFQLTLLKHAFAFPAARKIVYSTCSVHAEENEHAVIKALASDVARRRGWRVELREEQVQGLRMWERRGDVEAVRGGLARLSGMEGQSGPRGDMQEADQIAEACLRCQKGTAEGTTGFFAVKFVRNGEELVGQSMADETAIGNHEEEWEGFSDEEM